jgi:beta-aspartyl-peptidase (threonine type)
MADESANWTLVIHGGAGAMRDMGAAKEAKLHAGLVAALRVGGDGLRRGEGALWAVEAAVAAMERSGHFNAGRGSCLNEAGAIEVDAAVMSGDDRSIGAIGAVPRLTNGVRLAARLRRGSPHCLLVGAGALTAGEDLPDFTAEQSPPTPQRRTRWQQMMEKAKDGKPPLADLGGTHDEGDTVGAVAIDQAGHLAVAVSTGGLWLKTPGRVGDSPLAGAGFWAEDGVVAVCATGTGELIIRAGLCAEVRASMLAGATVKQAAADALDRMTAQFGLGAAGLIAIGPSGDIATPFHTAGMGRGYVSNRQPTPTTSIWPDERDKL